MRRLHPSFLFLLLLLSVGRVSAEGNCPAGMYPIGGQGVTGCAPMATSSTPAQASPQIIWVAKWGAVASAYGVVGISTDFPDERGAVQAALDQCAERGGKNCALDIAYRNTCVAAAIPSRDGVPLGGRGWYQTGLDLTTIKILAVESCAKGNGKSCEVAYTNCALP